MSEQRLAEMEQQIASLSATVSKMSEALIENQNANLVLHQTIVMLSGFHQAALVALASTHPAKAEALHKLQRTWNERRGALGDESIGDESRHAIQRHLEDFAKALGGTIL